MACSRVKYIQNTVTDTRSKYKSCVPLSHSEHLDFKFGGQVASPTTYILGAVTSRTLRQLPYPFVHHPTHEIEEVSISSIIGPESPQTTKNLQNNQTYSNTFPQTLSRAPSEEFLVFSCYFSCFLSFTCLPLAFFFCRHIVSIRPPIHCHSMKSLLYISHTFLTFVFVLLPPTRSPFLPLRLNSYEISVLPSPLPTLSPTLPH